MKFLKQIVIFIITSLILDYFFLLHFQDKCTCPIKSDQQHGPLSSTLINTHVRQPDVSESFSGILPLVSQHLPNASNDTTNKLYTFHTWIRLQEKNTSRPLDKTFSMNFSETLPLISNPLVYDFTAGFGNIMFGIASLVAIANETNRRPVSKYFLEII